MRPFRKIISVVLIVLILASPFVAWQNRYNALDWWRLRDYAAPPAVAALAQHTTMNDYARRLFYVNKPSLDSKVTFNKHCPITEDTIVQGCYVSNRGIYILFVNDARLSGMTEVTAAHEMLHAAYERLGSREREQVDGWLQIAFVKLNDGRINKNVENYKKRDPSIVANELHSILGTEVRNVGPELEKYYKRYFTDRHTVVAYSEQYEQVFTDLKNKAETYKIQLSQLKDRINYMNSNLEKSYDALTAKRDTMNNLISMGEYAAYNAEVSSYNNSIRQFNNDLRDYQHQIDQHNTILAQLNSIVLENQELVQAIDSKYLPQAEKLH